jgi:hypothetical protein
LFGDQPAWRKKSCIAICISSDAIARKGLGLKLCTKGLDGENFTISKNGRGAWRRSPQQPASDPLNRCQTLC